MNSLLLGVDADLVVEIVVVVVGVDAVVDWLLLLTSSQLFVVLWMPWLMLLMSLMISRSAPNARTICVRVVSAGTCIYLVCHS